MQDELLAKVAEATALSRRQIGSRQELNGDLARLSRLSSREREVLDLVVAGHTNKMIARQLDLTVRTIEFHRSNLMKKLDAQSLADLIELTRKFND